MTADDKDGHVPDGTDGYVAKMARLHRALQHDRGLIGRLEAVAGLARRTIRDCDGAGLAVVANGRTWSVATSDLVVVEVDLVQYDTGEGPCLEAIRNSSVIRLDIVEDREAYPHFAPGALDAGIETVLSLPAEWDGTTVGALNLYSKTAGAFRDEGTVGWGEELAAYAAESIVTSPLYAYSLEVVDEVIETLGTAEVVGQAIGILCARIGYSRLDAMDDLATSARLRSESLREAAEWVIREHDATVNDDDRVSGDSPEET